MMTGKKLRWLSVVGLALAACGCDRHNPSKAGADAHTQLPEAASTASAASDGALRGEPVRVAQEGSWKVRSTAPSGGTRASGKGRARAMGEEPVAAAPLALVAEEAAEPSPAPGAVGVAPGGTPMRAGSTDDNAAFDEFLTFLATWTDRAGMAGRYQPLQVKPRHFVRVTTATGAPLPAAKVTVRDDEGEHVLWTGTTYGDGRIPYYPKMDGQTARDREPPARVRVEVAFGDQRQVVPWNLQAPELTVKLGGVKAAPSEVKLDVLFVIDTTGSMGDEIDRIKSTLLRVTERLRALGTDFDLRYGAVLYRDVGDVYLTKAHPFTADIKAFDAALQSVSAGGGGDGPESVNQALAEAVAMQWREGAAKVAFLLADAPPHMDYQGDVPYGQSVVRAVAKGVRVHAVAASGLDPVGTLVFRQVAQLTRGKFIFIEYGSTAASAASHGVGGPVTSNNLDDIVYEQIRDEVNHWGKDRPASGATTD